MNNLITTLFQITCVFSALYLLYILFLNRLTFHNSNRLVLLLLLPVSIIIPFLEGLFPSSVARIIEVPLFEHATFEAVNSQLEVLEQPLVVANFNYGALITTIYWLVFSICLIRIFMTLRKLFVIKNKGIIQQKNGYQLVIANVPEIFSYFNLVFIPKNQMENYDPQILEHEKVHIRLKHSWDVLLMEIYIAFFWFNPLLYFYRKSLKSVHEFQADKGVLQKGVKTSQYMQLLLQSLEIKKPNNLYNYFNKPILKKRVTMMTKPNSNRLTRLSYLLLLPVCAFLMMAFTTTPIDKDPYLNSWELYEYVVEAPSLFPVQGQTAADISAKYGVIGKHKINKGVLHGGIDIRAKSGTPVLATADGTINTAKLKGDWGNLIIVTHADGYETWYAHLKEFNTTANSAIKKGDIIGYVGNTGKSTGPHLHYEVKQNGKRLDPMDYLE